MPPLSLFDHCLILTGPTGSGKSSLAVMLAERCGGEIISMDSMALYRGMDIGTAKPGEDVLMRVPHHLVNVLDPWEGASVAWWLAEAAQAVEQIVQRGRLPIIVGGTPLYLKALVCGLFQGPLVEASLRAKLEAQTTAELHSQLLEVDPSSAERIHRNDHKRLVRAMEVFLQTGRPLSSLQQQFDMSPRPRPFPILCIDRPRTELYDRINHRVDEMVAEGWVTEVKSLLELPYPLSREAAQAAGYAELISHIRGERSLASAVDAIKTRTRQLAKRQLTWFRHFPGIQMASPQDAEAKAHHYISSITPAIGSAGSPL